MSFQPLSSDYHAPVILEQLRPYLNLPRTQYSDNFTSFVDRDTQEHVEYREGLIAIGGSVAVVFVLWALILLILKCSGTNAGCAAGHGFQNVKTDQELYNQSGSTEQMEANRTRQKKNHSNDETSYHTSNHSGEELQDEGSYDNYSVAMATFRRSRRERRTHCFFWIFSCLALACVAPIIILVVQPLKTTAENSEDPIVNAREVLREMDLMLITVGSSMEAATDVSKTIPFNFSLICPVNFSHYSNNTQIDTVQPDAYESFLQTANTTLTAMEKLHTFMVQDLSSQQDFVESEMSRVERFHSKFDNVFHYVQSAQSDTKTFVWLVPLFLALLVCAVVVLMVGVYMVRKRQYRPKLEAVLSYGALPMLLLGTLVVGAIAVGAGISAVLADDVCNHGRSDGSPHDTLVALMDPSEQTDSNGIYAFINAYTGGCENGATPTSALDAVQETVQAEVEEIWSTLVQIDSMGRNQLIDLCGSDIDVFQQFLTDARNLARFMTNVGRGIDNMRGTLDCSRIYPIYIEIVEEHGCEEVSAVLVWSLIFFFLLCFATMGMITLRAAWRHVPMEDDIYGEDEEIENMFVDEHEEYLAYISKYKHEWEEYEGFDGDLPVASPNRPMPEIYTSDAPFERGASSDSGSEKGSHLVGEEFFEDEHYKNLSVLKPGMLLNHNDLTKHAPFEPYASDTYSPTTAGSEDVSFLSIQDGPAMPQSANNLGRDIPRPPPLLGDPNGTIENDDRETMTALESHIEQQRTRDVLLVRNLSREIDTQNHREQQVMDALSFRGEENRVSSASAPTLMGQQPDQDDTFHEHPAASISHFSSRPIRKAKSAESNGSRWRRGMIQAPPQDDFPLLSKSASNEIVFTREVFEDETKSTSLFENAFPLEEQKDEEPPSPVSSGECSPSRFAFHSKSNLERYNPPSPPGQLSRSLSID